MLPRRKTLRVLSVVGARPNFMKVAPIIAAIRTHNRQAGRNGLRIEHNLVHTGQHYDKIMSGSFFRDLKIPKPDFHLEVGSGSHAVQTAAIMKKFESVILDRRPDVIVVVGDVNSTVACALVASKTTYGSNGLRPRVAHVEAGLRSFDRSMPEELNRIVTDHLSDLLFVTEKSGLRNLKREGISQDKVRFVGNTMIDTLLAFRDVANKSTILDRLGLVTLNKTVRQPVSRLYVSDLKPRLSVLPYGLITLHRPSNVDNKKTFRAILGALSKVAVDVPLLFPCHPRTRSTITNFGLQHYFRDLDLGRGGCPEKTINLTEPLGYLDFVCLMSRAKVVFTDSGGIQEETTCLGVPCVTLRENTERPVTVTHGTNVLAGIKPNEILIAFREQEGRKIRVNFPELWDGKAAERIVSALATWFSGL